MSIEDELTTDNSVALLGVGDRLRLEREARGLSLDDVSQTLKISRRILDLVEANAWQELPGYTFARGVVRGYAKFVHLDAEPLLLELEKAPLPKPPVLELPQSTRAALPVPGQSKGWDRLAMIAGILMVAGAVMAYFLVPDDWLSGKVNSPNAPVVREVLPKGDVPGGTVVTAPLNTAPTGAGVDPVPGALPGAPTIVPVPLPIAGAPAVAASATQLLVIRFDEASWVEVKDRNGTMLLSENVTAGSERIVNGDVPIGLALGNAEGVRVTFRGQSVDLKPHTRQKVARLSLE